MFVDRLLNHDRAADQYAMPRIVARTDLEAFNRELGPLFNDQNLRGGLVDRTLLKKENVPQAQAQYQSE